MDTELVRLIEDRLSAQGVAGEQWSLLVLAACEGEEALEESLGGLIQRRKARGRRVTVAPGEGPGAYLKSITVEGFRGIGRRVTLELAVGPGLTLVIGRNGSGKSSFAEGLEVLLTNENWRWRNKTVIWQGGWRNLHHSPAEISADFSIEGEPGLTTITRQWADGAELDNSSLHLSMPSRKSAGPGGIGWEPALVAYRPFLSYNELGSMFDIGPTQLHDNLSRILGLGELDAAVETLRRARLDRDGLVNAPKKSAPSLTASLNMVDDERARSAVAAIVKRTPDVEAVRRIVSGETLGASSMEALGNLRVLSTLSVPTGAVVGAICDRLRALAERVEALSGDDSARLNELEGLLTGALSYHERHGDGDCPVCGTQTAINAAWRKRVLARLAELEARNSEWKAAERDTQSVLAEVRELLVRRPSWLGAGEAVGIKTAKITAAWEAFASMPPTPGLRQLADHIQTTSAALESAAEEVRRSASAELDRREGAWRPLAARLAGWLAEADSAEAAAKEGAELKRAETWLKDASAEIRRQRFEPIAVETIKNWKELRQQSSVDLLRVALEGAGSQRHVTLDVNVDGVGTAALGVMSQGELHSIALSMFLPRAMLPESPFRFLVIDDPVQSMDPARVDGLAQVLGRTAKTREVVVFTHDDRLPEAARRLGIDATIVEVTRHEDSVVDLRESLDPVERNLDDANALVITKSMPLELAHAVVPGYCRNAIEAAAIEVVRRRRIGRGETHYKVEQLLDSQKTTNTLLALALWDDAGRAGEVMKSISQRWGDDLGDALAIAVRGSHAGYQGSLDVLVRDTRRLCTKVSQLPV